MRRASASWPVIAAALLAAPAAAEARNFGDYRYEGSEYDVTGEVQNFFGGYGADFLDPWLVFTADGRDIVRFGFADERGRVSSHNARRANTWFRRLADANEDRILTDSEIRAGLMRGKLIQYARFLRIPM